jgi:hypothetical protein
MLFRSSGRIYYCSIALVLEGYACEIMHQWILCFSYVLFNVIYKANRLFCTNFVSEDDYINCAN